MVVSESKSQADFVSKSEPREDVSAGEDRLASGSRMLSPGSLSSGSPLSCGGSVCDRSSDCDFWRPPSPSSSPGAFTHTFIQTYSRKKCHKHKLHSCVGCYLITFNCFGLLKCDKFKYSWLPVNFKNIPKLPRLSMRFYFILFCFDLIYFYKYPHAQKRNHSNQLYCHDLWV